MFEEPLPLDLEQVEQNVGSLMRFNPQPELGRRIVDAMHGEIRRERNVGRWRFALGLAAGVFVWLHVSFYAASITEFHMSETRAALSSYTPVSGQRAVLFNLPCDE
jgi:hypothetical protein